MGTRNAHFLGFARVQLKHLELDPLKHIGAKRVKRLIHDFKLVGCNNNDIAHAVPVLVDQASLDAALTRANLTPSALYNIEENSPILHFPNAEKLRILYGDHRLEAAKRFLSANDRWWSVLLYDSKISAKARASVLQGNRQRSIALNGRDLASLLGETDQAVVDVWTSNMTRTHESTLRRLRKDDDGKLSLALQEVLSFRGLQYGAGNWDPIIAMRCREEVYTYLNAIAKTWEYILGADLRPDQLDETTVLALEMYFPAYSSQDCDAILKLFVTNKVFPSIQNIRDRENIGRRVLSCKRIVTFTSFFNDFIYLRTCFDGLKALLPSTWKDDGRSFKQAFAHNWVPDHKSDNHKRMSEWHLGEPPENFRDCYADLWLFAMREFPYLSDGKASRPLQDGTSADNQNEPWSPMGLKQAQLAYQASILGGFETDEIERFKASHPTEIPQDSPSLEKPEVSSNNEALRRKERSNRPSRTNYAQYRGSLHRVYVYDTSAVEQMKYVTAYAIARDIVHCCWRPDIDRWLRDPEVQQQPQYNDMENSFSATYREGPRKGTTETFKHKVSKPRNPRVEKKNLNDNQQVYSKLMREVAADFAVRDAQPEASPKTQNKWNMKKPYGPARVTSIKEEFQLQDDIQGDLGNEDIDVGIMSVQPLGFTVKKSLGSPSGTSRSEGSTYSTVSELIQHSESEPGSFESTPRSQNGSPSEREFMPGLQNSREAVARYQTQSPIASEAPNKPIEEMAGVAGSLRVSGVKTDQQCAKSPVTSISPAGIENRKDSGLDSLRKQSGSASRSGDSGSTSWPKFSYDTIASGFTDRVNDPQIADNQPGSISARSPRTASDSVPLQLRRRWHDHREFLIRHDGTARPENWKRKRTTVVPNAENGERGRKATRSEDRNHERTAVVLDERYNKVGGKRLTVFPKGLNGEVTSDRS